MTVYLLMESRYAELAVDGIRDTVPSGFPEDMQASRVVFKSKQSVDPFGSREAAEKEMLKCKELGVDVRPFEFGLDEEGRII